ncbi:transposase [Actinomadura sp. NPDC048021]|uniref:transposase n=1 Tax=Actinomadura sp. NPDC048021 TaxID=3155385 RepID=UPI0033ED4945
MGGRAVAAADQAGAGVRAGRRDHGHVGYDKHDAAGRGSDNSHNGTPARTVLTDVAWSGQSAPGHRRQVRATTGPQAAAPVDRGGMRWCCRCPAKGLTHAEISAHLAEVYGASVSKQTISTITDKGDGGHGRMAEPDIERRTLTRTGFPAQQNQQGLDPDRSHGQPRASGVPDLH